MKKVRRAGIATSEPRIIAVAEKDRAEIGVYLTNKVSRSIVYTLMLSQPLTRREIESHPLRQQFLSLTRWERSSKEGEMFAANLRTLLYKGCDCGMLCALDTRRENYYFLNSDVMIVPRPLDRGDSKDSFDLFTDRSTTGAVKDDECPSRGFESAPSGILPIPYLDSSMSILLWLDWLVTERKRRILAFLVENGPTPRPRLRDLFGFWSDQIIVREGLPLGILRRSVEGIDFQFSQLPSTEQSGGRSPPKCWTTGGFALWLARSYEPLRCVHGASAYLRDKGKKTPMELLHEMREDRCKVVKKNRRDYLSTNFMYRVFGWIDQRTHMDHAADSEAAARANSRVFLAGNERYVWTKRHDHLSAIAAMNVLQEAKKLPRAHTIMSSSAPALNDLLVQLAKERVHEHLHEKQKKLDERIVEHRRGEFGIDQELITTLAALEMEREEHDAERRFFNKFLDILAGRDGKKGTT